MAIKDTGFPHTLYPRRFVTIKELQDFGILIATAVCGCKGYRISVFLIATVLCGYIEDTAA